MKYLQILLAFVVLSGLAGVHATPPIEYTAAVRNADGYVMANMPVKFLLEIVDKPASWTNTPQYRLLGDKNNYFQTKINSLRNAR